MVHVYIVFRMYIDIIKFWKQFTRTLLTKALIYIISSATLKHSYVYILRLCITHTGTCEYLRRCVRWCGCEGVYLRRCVRWCGREGVQKRCNISIQHFSKNSHHCTTHVGGEGGEKVLEHTCVRYRIFLYTENTALDLFTLACTQFYAKQWDSCFTSRPSLPISTHAHTHVEFVEFAPIKKQC